MHELHTRTSLRLPYYDYTKQGAYFITICCYQRKSIFGNIENGNMKLSTFGDIANEEWINTQRLRNYLRLDTYTIMPNHFHGIIWITRRDMTRHVPTYKNHVPTYRKFGQPISHSIGAIVGAFKAATTKRIHQIGHNSEKIWQSGYYEHVIRNDLSLNKIQNYIDKNPSEWTSDPENIPSP